MSIFLGVPTWLCTVTDCKFTTYESAEVANKHLGEEHRLKSRRNQSRHKIRVVTCLLCSRAFRPIDYEFHSHELLPEEVFGLRRLITPISGQRTPLPAQLLKERPHLDASISRADTKDQATWMTLDDIFPDPTFPPTLENMLADASLSYPRQALQPILEKEETLV